MAYNQNIPQATDALAQSQQDILNNFLANYNAFNVNHVTFNAGADMGKHKWITLPVQNPSPPIAFAAGELAMYSFLSPVTSQNEIYINKTNEVTVVQTPSTASILSVASAPGNNVSGWTYLPSGILMKWGSATANGDTAIVFPVAATIPVFTDVMSMQITTFFNTAIDTNTFVRLSAFTNVGFNCYGSSRTNAAAAPASFQYLAIGY
jgi:hypothetical protein